MILRFGWAMAGAMQVACGLVASADMRAARTEVNDRVAFIRPVTGGYAVATSDGAAKRTVPVGKRPWVSSLTPDLSGYYLVEIGKTLAGDRLTVIVRLAERDGMEVLS